MHYWHVSRVGLSCIVCKLGVHTVYWDGSALNRASRSVICVGNTGQRIVYLRV